MNYEEEYSKALQPISKFWKPSEGRHNVTLLSEGEELPEREWDQKAKDKSGNEYIRKKITKPVKFRAKFGLEEVDWIINKGKRQSGLYVQVLRMILKNGKATGTTFTLLVQGEGVERRYTIPEAI